MNKTLEQVFEEHRNAWYRLFIAICEALELPRVLEWVEKLLSKK